VTGPNLIIIAKLKSVSTCFSS